MCGNIGKIGFDNSVFLSEKQHADRNISLAYYMRENFYLSNDEGISNIKQVDEHEMIFESSYKDWYIIEHTNIRLYA